MNQPEASLPEPANRSVSHYNPVSVDVKEATGTAFLGIIALILLLALLHLQRQNRALSRQLAEGGERPS